MRYERYDANKQIVAEMAARFPYQVVVDNIDRIAECFRWGKEHLGVPYVDFADKGDHEAYWAVADDATWGTWGYTAYFLTAADAVEYKLTWG